ncbi:flagellar hook-basal body complex protein FliE [Hydrogenophilus thiooxidans]|uniref:flagellar hook-basal body complex protein FliE n=1 Tax=Hydrogenophilus thiooxidans TaxID=2820326 RepID=UPI001C23F1F8|nr:flagellar hook-basal body complex protein FliE [Hydrogenophilus thiooxidans]
MDTNAINQLLAQMQQAQALAKGGAAAQQPEAERGTTDFAQVLDQALKEVSAQSAEAKAQAERFVAGDPAVNLADVMIDLEKASLSFNQMVQVRNRLVSAYQDIMNMPV